LNNNVLLLVEDNSDDVELTIYALKKNNIMTELAVARDGIEALDYLFGTGTFTGRDTRDMPKVILLDLKLPKIDGLEVLKRLRENENTKSLPVVVLTSSKEEKDVIRSYQLGANSYIRKAVDFSQFFDDIREIVNYWLVLNVADRTGKGD